MNKTSINIWSWTGAVMLALSLVALWVWPKFVGVSIHPIFGWAELQTGATWLEPGGRYAFGFLAAILAILVVIPKTRIPAAWAALGVSLAVVGLHLTPWLGWNIPNYGPLMAAIAEGKTVAEIQAMGLKGDRGAHLTLAIINASLAAITLASGKLTTGAKVERARPMHLSGA